MIRVDELEVQPSNRKYFLLSIIFHQYSLVLERPCKRQAGQERPVVALFLHRKRHRDSGQHQDREPHPHRLRRVDRVRLQDRGHGLHPTIDPYRGQGVRGAGRHLHQRPLPHVRQDGGGSPWRTTPSSVRGPSCAPGSQ